MTLDLLDNIWEKEMKKERLKEEITKGYQARSIKEVLYLIAEDMPEKNGSFLQDQIIGVKKAGLNTTICCINKKPNYMNNEYKKELLNNTIYLNIPRNKLLRILKFMFFVFFDFIFHPKRVLESFNYKKYGMVVFSLKPFFVQKYLRGYDGIIHAHFGQVGLMACVLKSLNNNKLITSFHGADIHSYPRKYPKVYKNLFKVGDLFTANSEFTKKKLIKLGCNEKKIRIVKMGLDLNKFKYKNKKSKKFRVLSVGRLVEKKGFYYSIKALNGLPIEYNIIGDGILKKELEKISKDNINFLGSKSHKEVINMINDSDIIISPSVKASNGDMEGQLVVNQEAQLLKKPVITTDHNGIKEGVAFGYILPEKNIINIRERVLYLMNNLSSFNVFSELGKEFIITNFDRLKIGKELGGIYNEIR